ncbi:hypothetical protein AB0N62_29595 [Streptomyces sp. NPDC093982]|uniref:hypothetical protein n=1 Tax=Streptomyces sp. NPDC093982 TaxID=3155077 RepID=UPI003431A0F9
MSFEPEVGVFTAVVLTSGYGPDNHEAAVALDLLADEDQSEGETLTVLGFGEGFEADAVFSSSPSSPTAGAPATPPPAR